MTKLKINHVYMVKDTGDLVLCRFWNENLMVLESEHELSIYWNDNWFIDLGEL